MQRFLKIFFNIIFITVLTIVTQVGGFVFLLTWATFPFVNNKIASIWKRSLVKLMSFIGLYLTTTFLIVPPVARIFGRVPMPVFENNYVQPANLLTCVLNRHYVRPELKNTLFTVSKELNRKYPGTVVNYLDANFPFINGFPLFPHLSHNDGRKLDLSFQYNDLSGQITRDVPSFIGYGICEEPLTNEENRPRYCADKGNWQYSFLRNAIPQHNKAKFEFDEARNRHLINLITSQHNIGKVFIEPHLKSRLNLTSAKIRFHGCQAVRHDDHIHVQLK